VPKVLIQPHAVAALPQDAGERRLAHLDRLSTQIRSVELHQIEGAEEPQRLVPPPAKDVKGRHAPLVGAHHLAVDEARAHREVVHGLDHERETDRPVIASTSDQPDANGVAPAHQPVTVVLDLVNPV
jgi:hypothetical protein